MAVVIQDRLALGVLVVQPAGGFGREQKIFVDEWHGEPKLKHNAGCGGAKGGP
jgi:hypothetical protein